VKIDIGLELAQETSEQLSSAHASSIVLKLAEGLILVEMRGLCLESFINLMSQAQLAEIRLLKDERPIDFFFMRFSMRLADWRACSPAFGLMSKYASCPDEPPIMASRNRDSRGVNLPSSGLPRSPPSVSEMWGADFGAPGLPRPHFAFSYSYGRREGIVWTFMWTFYFLLMPS
jgi:hypothetical protein